MSQVDCVKVTHKGIGGATILDGQIHILKLPCGLIGEIIPKVEQNTPDSINKNKIIETMVYIFSICCLSLNACLWYRIYQSKVKSRDEYIFRLTTKHSKIDMNHYLSID